MTAKTPSKSTAKRVEVQKEAPAKKEAPKLNKPEANEAKVDKRTVTCGNCGAKHPFGTQTCDKCGYTRVSM